MAFASGNWHDRYSPDGGSLLRALSLIPIIPILLGLWLAVLAAVVFVEPAQIMTVNLAGLALTAGIAAFLFPGVTIILGLFLITLQPENFLFVDRFASEHFGKLEVQSVEKIVIVLTLAPAVLRHGLLPVINTAVGAIVVLFIMSFTVSSVYPGLDMLQMIKSFIGLALPFVYFNLNIQRRWIIPHLVFITLIPFISIVMGAIAQGLELRSIDGRLWEFIGEEFTGATRLRGVNIAAYLAFYGYIAVMTGLYLAIAEKKKAFLGIVAIIIGIVLFTGTRTPTLCAVLLAAFGIFFSSGRDLRSSSKFAIGVTGMVLLTGLLAIYWPSLELRFSTSATYGESGINTSGRADMWNYMLGVWETNPVFGRGIGAGAIALLDVQDARLSRAVHNEYIRLLADGGIAGLIVYILGVGFLMVSQARDLTRTAGMLIIGVFLSFALYSFTDNTISAPPPLVMFYGLALIFAKARYDRQDARERQRLQAS